MNVMFLNPNRRITQSPIFVYDRRPISDYFNYHDDQKHHTSLLSELNLLGVLDY